MEEKINYAQEGPRLGNQFLEDEGLKRYVEHFFPKDMQGDVVKELTELGDRVHEDYLEMAHNAELFEPRMEKYDAWGNKVNKLHLAEGWKFFHKESAKQGLVAIPYEQKLGEKSRILQACKLFLFCPSGGLFGCPLAMTDGAAFVLRDILNDRKSSPEEVDADVKLAYQELTTRDPLKFITSGQWMTEKRGGSDVSGATDTVAVLDKPSGKYKLYGYKWFTSATDSSMTLALARVVEDEKFETFRKENKVVLSANTPRPSMFFVRMKKKNAIGEVVLNDMEIVRLKDKLGTKQVPTAEMVLNGTQAVLLSEEGKGVSGIIGMLHITRYHNAISSTSYMRRILNLAFDFARKRYAFGKYVAEKPLHLLKLREMDLDVRGNLLWVFEFSRLLGKVDARTATKNEFSILRIMSSLLKMFTSKEGVRITSEGVECFGGVGVMENSHIPQILRDSQILPIWEGTTNILSLDLLRATQKEPKAVEAFSKYLLTNAEQAPQQLTQMILGLFNFIKSAKSAIILEFNARKLAFNISRVIIASLANRVLVESARQKDSRFAEHDEMVANYWLQRTLQEFEPLKNELPENEILQFQQLILNKEMGKSVDSRNVLRARY